MLARSSPSARTPVYRGPSVPGPGLLYGRCCMVGNRSTNAGITGSVGPRTRDTIEPKFGFPSRCDSPIEYPVSVWKLLCSSRSPTIDLSTAYLSAIPAN